MSWMIIDLQRACRQFNEEWENTDRGTILKKNGCTLEVNPQGAGYLEICVTVRYDAIPLDMSSSSSSSSSSSIPFCRIRDRCGGMSGNDRKEYSPGISAREWVRVSIFDALEFIDAHDSSGKVPGATEEGLSRFKGIVG